MTRLTLALVFLIAPSSEAQACEFKFCQHRQDRTPSRHYITNSYRQVIGDLYQPGPGARYQIRNNHRQILGYIERDGTITNRSRQKVGEILPPVP